MEIFRDLEIHSDPNQVAATADLIERDPPVGWVRDRSAEERARSGLILKPRVTFCFSYVADGERPTALLILTQKDTETFFVSNIMPLSKHQLEHGEYNAILEDFYERVIQPHTGPGGLTATLSSGQADLEHWMSHDTAELLRQFSACANRVTGSALPADRNRWNAFVVASHRDGSRLDAADLRRWLIEVDGWQPEVAAQLTIEYKYGRELLAYAEGRRSA